MNHVILFRKGIDHEHESEFAIAQKYFDVIELRSKCPSNSVVIGRFSVLPFYNELCQDLAQVGSCLINSFEEHSWISNFEYYHALKRFTPETWDDNDFYRCTHPGPFVLKGRTNSRKIQWATHMFAPDKKAASLLASELAADPLIGPQGVIYRKYIPLVTLESSINGLPFTNEWRFFYYKNKLLSYGYYWTQAEHPELAKMNEEGLAFANQVANITSNYTNFFVLDIAEKQEGGWILIEINEGQQSGLSSNDPDIFYQNLKNLVNPPWTSLGY